MFKYKSLQFTMLIIVVSVLLIACNKNADLYTKGNVLDKYTSTTPLNELDIIQKEIELSTEGGNIWALQKDGVLDSMVVTIFGEIGSIEHTYHFGDAFLTYTKTITEYSQPMYMQNKNFHINDVKVERFILYNDEFYSFLSNSDQTIKLSENDKSRFINEISVFLNLLYEKEE